MATYNKFEDLPVWQEARRLCKLILTLTQEDTFAKDYRMVSQIKSAAGSVMDNIAEGFERGSRLKFVNHLSYAKGSAGEVRSQLYGAIDFIYVSKETAEAMITEYRSLAANIAGFIDYLNKTSRKGQKFENRV